MSGYGLFLSMIGVCSGGIVYGYHRWRQRHRSTSYAHLKLTGCVSARALDLTVCEPAPDLQSLVRDTRYRVVARVPLTEMLAVSEPAEHQALAHIHAYAVVVDPNGMPCVVIECQSAQGLAERKQAQHLRQLLNKAGIKHMALSPYASVNTFQDRLDALLKTPCLL